MGDRIVYALIAALLCNGVVLVVLPAASSHFWGVPPYDQTVEDVGVHTPPPPPPSWSAWVQSPVSPAVPGPGARPDAVSLGPYSFRPPAGWVLAPEGPGFPIGRRNSWSPAAPDGSGAELRVLFAAGNFVPGAPPVTMLAVPAFGRSAMPASPRLEGPPLGGDGEPSAALVANALDSTWRNAIGDLERLRKAGARVDFRELRAEERGPELVSFRGLKFAREEAGHVVDGIAYYGPGRNWTVSMEATAVEPHHEVALRAATAAMWTLDEGRRP